MAPVTSPALSFLLLLLLLLLLLPQARPEAAAAAAAAAVQYDLRLSTDGPTTTGADGLVLATLIAGNGSHAVFPDDLKQYRFHWVYSPLLLTGKSEGEFNSAISVTGQSPGDFPIAVWVTPADCWLCQPLAKGFTLLHVTEFIVGNLIMVQRDGISSQAKQGSRLARDTTTQASFVLHDPSNYFKSASFLYNWDFGDGTQLVTEDSFVYYNYSTAGTCTVHLKVVAEWKQLKKSPDEKGLVQKTGEFTASLELLDAIQSIQVLGSSETHVMQTLNFSLQITGSPPLALCWLVKSDCIPLEGDECHLVEINGTSCNVSHTFNVPGRYCLSVRAQNAVNRLHQYHPITVGATGIHPAVFALPCVALISVMLGLIVYATFRSTSQPKDLVEVADFDFSPMSDKSTVDSEAEGRCAWVCCRCCPLQAPHGYREIIRETHGLLHPLHKPAKTYMV
ncbi:transmembrane protein 130 [Ornithorhynchus anatinus]|uniref:transmembrane protein 130 n=1 Tax=Ornithorhynchus anatinus TaxID=9258 RepID=UPI0010A7FCDA|nr:transmembrane protein 130 [Ornithorhynchus anatinus]